MNTPKLRMADIETCVENVSAAVPRTMLRTGARHPDADEYPTSSAVHHKDKEATPEQMYAKLNEYLQLECKFQPRLCLSDNTQVGEVTRGARDGAAHVLRSLKIWFDLPSEVFIHAVNLFDRFLTKMKVRPCHLPCITVSCMNIAIDHHAHTHKCDRKVSVEGLVSISQSACTAGDVERMSRIIVDKLGSSKTTEYITTAHWVMLFTDLVNMAAKHLDIPMDIQESTLLNQLEIVTCEYYCANSRSSALCLVLVFHLVEAEIISGRVDDPHGALFQMAQQMQGICQMSDISLAETSGLVRSVLSRYEARAAQPHRQRLVWRLSERTLKVLRPTDRLTSLLPTIEEQQHTTPQRPRSGSESSVSEETSDWPRSPVLPVYFDS